MMTSIANLRKALDEIFGEEMCRFESFGKKVLCSCNEDK